MITVTEKVESRSVVFGKSAEFIYSVSGTSSEEAALAAVMDEAPATYVFNQETASGGYAFSLIRLAPQLKPIWVNSTNDSGQWEASVSYAESNNELSRQANENVFAFDTGGGTQHIVQAENHIATYCADSIVGMNGVLGFDGTSVNGMDRVTPQYQWTETVYMSPADVTWGYRRTVASLTGKLNDGTFRGFPAKEVLFLGASGQRRGRSQSDLWEISFKFSQRTTPTGGTVTIGAGATAITVNNVHPWDFISVWYRDKVDSSASVLVKPPYAVFHDEVYKAGSFALLGIGTGDI